MTQLTETRNERRAWALITACAALLQLFLAVTCPYPYVIESGDNGSILYIIARWLDPAAFEHDVLLGVDGSTSFYRAALMWPNYLMGLAGMQLGLFYVIACFPIVLAQMGGFYVLGKRLFAHRGLALALAFITLPVVYTISGDLWGMYNSPLMRAAYGASLPWLLVLLITPSGPRPYLLMLAAGLASYLHLPSGPPVALALLIICFLRAGPAQGWLRASLHHMLAGVLYLLLMSPYAILYSQGFAAGDNAALGVYANSPYGNVRIALDHLVSLRGPNRMSILVGRVPGLGWAAALTKPLFGAVFVLGSAALVLLCLPGLRRLRGSVPRSGVWVAGFFVVVFGIGVGLPALDQAVARALERGPVQLDLIRATRFAVPGTYLGVFFALFWLAGRLPHLRGACIGASVLLTGLVWIVAYPSTSQGLYRLTKGESMRDPALVDFGQFVLQLKTQDDLDALTPVLRYDYQSSALRYIGFLPLRFNRKDNNFITYSGTASASEHQALMDRIDAIRNARRAPEEQVPLIDAFMETLGGRDIVIDRRVVLAEAETRLLEEYRFEKVLERGDFALLRRAQQ